MISDYYMCSCIQTRKAIQPQLPQLPPLYPIIESDDIEDSSPNPLYLVLIRDNYWVKWDMVDIKNYRSWSKLCRYLLKTYGLSTTTEFEINNTSFYRYTRMSIRNLIANRLNTPGLQIKIITN